MLLDQDFKYTEVIYSHMLWGQKKESNERIIIIKKQVSVVDESYGLKEATAELAS